MFRCLQDKQSKKSETPNSRNHIPTLELKRYEHCNYTKLKHIYIYIYIYITNTEYVEYVFFSIPQLRSIGKVLRISGPKLYDQFLFSQCFFFCAFIFVNICVYIYVSILCTMLVPSSRVGMWFRELFPEGLIISIWRRGKSPRYWSLRLKIELFVKKEVPLAIHSWTSFHENQHPTIFSSSSWASPQ